MLSVPTDLGLQAFKPGHWVLLKDSLPDQLTPNWNRHHLVNVTTHFTLKLQEITLWLPQTQMKRTHISQAPERRPGATDPLDYLCEPLST